MLPREASGICFNLPLSILFSDLMATMNYADALLGDLVLACGLPQQHTARKLARFCSGGLNVLVQEVEQTRTPQSRGLALTLGIVWFYGISASDRAPPIVPANGKASALHHGEWSPVSPL